MSAFQALLSSTEIVFPSPRWRWKLNEASSPFADSGDDGQGVSLALQSGTTAAGTTINGRNAMEVTTAGTGLTGAFASGISYDCTGDFSVFLVGSFPTFASGVSIALVSLSDAGGSNQLFYFANWTLAGCLYVITSGAPTLSTGVNQLDVLDATPHSYCLTCQRVSSGVYNVLGYYDGALYHTSPSQTIGATSVYTKIGVGYDTRGAGNGFTSRVGDAYQECNLFEAILTPTQVAALHTQAT